MKLTRAISTTSTVFLRMLALAAMLASGLPSAPARAQGPPTARPAPAPHTAAQVTPPPARPARAEPQTPVVLPPARPEITAYNRTWAALYFLGTAWELLGLALLVRRRGGPRLRDAAERRARRLLPQAALFYVPFSLFMLLWHLPFGLAGYLHERSYGFATLGPGLWLMDLARHWLFGLPTLFGVCAGYWLLRRSPRRWWLWLWALSVPVQLGMIVVWPVAVAPAYNDFTPLRDAALRDRLGALAEKAGIGGAPVYVADKSRRTTKLNAYVSGAGPTARMVLWDTTLRALSHDEIVAIMGHEMGHYALRHSWWRFGEGVVGAFVLLWLLSRVLPWAVARWGARYGIRDPGDLAGLPLALLCLSVLLFLQTPVESALSRMHERAADRYGLRLTGLNVPMARAFVAFVEHDFADPDPPSFLVFWFYSHPPLRERVESALNYQPSE